ncbi:synaptic vesicle VAT-1 family membrane protein [Paraliomyxa miuraensis]|uniref:synaptic vesicle VAT-1 family membrane protein n=1 Tax=Paraliomyxa miuraensis TaxID=376150 RepID=UPI00225721EC|nr:medium chain dehydrogenase/reductase family protein [Paraliomyxa miuraensis]MCX4241068.1 medium chain dehydrogenase/reductase family protein [Paraliomyxa miuraensis]
MQAIVIDRPGGYDRLVLRDRPSLPLPAGHVRVTAQACGVNYADCIVRMGLYSSAKEYVGWPITPGFEVAGTVAERGDGVDDLEPGQEVLAVTRFGGYASEVVVPRHQVFRRPRGFSADEAAALPSVGLTAWYALLELGRPALGARVLVHSAAGGVGSVLVQLGRHLGCQVAAVVGSPHKVEAARALGAHLVIDRSSQDLWAQAEAFAPQGYDAIFDANGVATLRQSYRHIAPTGRLVVYGFATMLPRAGQRRSWLRLAWHYLRTPRFDPLEMTQHNRSVMGFNLSYLFEHTDRLARGMELLLGWADDGVLRPAPIEVFALADAAAAQRRLETGQTIGKLVLRP